MRVIVTHESADFDALASTVAALKLYPGSQIVLGRRVAPAVRDFLALHKDSFDLVYWSDVDFAEVTDAVIVDVRQARRISAYAPLAERIRAGEVTTHIWDHHAASPDDLPSHWELVEPVGSTATLLIEEIQRRGLDLSPLEATLLALGIYTDTGSLTYAGTTPRDAHAVAYVLACGASLKMVNRYLRSALTENQRAVLSELLGAVQVYEIGGVDVGFGAIELTQNVDGLAAVTTQVIKLEGHAALFGMYRRKNKLQVIGRARVPYIDVGAVLRGIGGGGHPGAGSAMVKNGDPDEVRARLLEILNADPPHPRAVSDVMTSPVRTVEADVSLTEADALLAQLGYTGLPVTKDGKLTGVLSRRDLKSARKGERMHLSVASCMSGAVRTIDAADPLDDALELMVRHDIGRLPVLREGRLVGIISRSDLIRILYREPDHGEA